MARWFVCEEFSLSLSCCGKHTEWGLHGALLAARRALCGGGRGPGQSSYPTTLLTFCPVSQLCVFNFLFHPHSISASGIKNYHSVLVIAQLLSSS
jgi:hypothetical protein